MSDIDKMIYVSAFEALESMENAAISAKTDKEKRNFVMKYINMIPKRAKTEDFGGDMNLWTSSAVGIGMYMLEFVESFAKQNGVKYAPNV